MHRALPLCILSLSLACTQLDEPASASPAEASGEPAGASVMSSGSEPRAGAALSASLRELATATTTADKLELRFDAEGRIVKQALYHGDADAIPAALIEAANERYPGHGVRGYETEHYADLGAVFELEFETREGQHCELAGREDGSIIYTECRIDPATLPESVSKSIDDTFAGAKLIEAEIKTADEQQSYSVELEHGGREYYLHLDAEGQVTAKHVRVPALVELPLP